MNFYIDTNQFKCSCGYTQNSGFICRHIFRIGIQLNFNELPTELYPYRWRKSPTDDVIFEHYKNFYSNTSTNSLVLESNYQ